MFKYLHQKNENVFLNEFFIVFTPMIVRRGGEEELVLLGS